MLEVYVEHEDVIRGESALIDYLSDHVLDFSPIISEAKNELVRDIKDKRLMLRKLCVRLSLQTSVTKTSSQDPFAGAKSIEDLVERQRLMITVTALTGDAGFMIQGTNDDSSETWADIKSVIVSAKGKFTWLLEGETYKFYRLKLLEVGTTITYSSYLVETGWERCLLLRARWQIYESLNELEADVYTEKAERYEKRYTNALVNINYSYDKDDSGVIAEDESKSEDYVFHRGGEIV